MVYFLKNGSTGMTQQARVLYIVATKSLHANSFLKNNIYRTASNYTVQLTFPSVLQVSTVTSPYT